MADQTVTLEPVRQDASTRDNNLMERLWALTAEDVGEYNETLVVDDADFVEIAVACGVRRNQIRDALIANSVPV